MTAARTPTTMIGEICAAADRAARALEAQLAERERNDADMIAGGHVAAAYWQVAHRMRCRLITARALRDALSCDPDDATSEAVE